jgi:hypothetical protein
MTIIEMLQVLVMAALIGGAVTRSLFGVVAGVCAAAVLIILAIAIAVAKAKRRDDDE